MPGVTFAGCRTPRRGRDDVGVRRRSPLITLAAVLTAALALLAAPTQTLAAPSRPLAAPTTLPPAPPTTVATVGTLVDGRPATECISANPRPDCDTASSADGRTLVLLGILLVALSGIGVVVVRSTRRNSRARAAGLPDSSPAYRQGP